MSYIAPLDRKHPGCILFIMDQSSSMDEPFGRGEGGQSKADGVADAMNKMLSTFILACSKEEGIRNYFDVGVIRYCQPSAHTKQIGPAFGGSLAGRPTVPIAELADHPLRIEDREQQMPDGAGGLVTQTVKFPVWFDPTTNGGTPMCEALQYASQVLSSWITEHRHSYPPIVVHITDGEATDGNPEPNAEAIKALATDDGNALLFNCHISSRSGAPCMFPAQEEGLADQYAQRLFRMSSVLPERMRQEAQQRRYEVGDLSRGFVYQADFADLVNFLTIGTQVELR